MGTLHCATLSAATSAFSSAGINNIKVNVYATYICICMYVYMYNSGVKGAPFQQCSATAETIKFAFACGCQDMCTLHERKTCKRKLVCICIKKRQQKVINTENTRIFTYIFVCSYAEGNDGKYQEMMQKNFNGKIPHATEN